jgi:acetyltransferase
MAFPSGMVTNPQHDSGANTFGRALLYSLFNPKTVAVIGGPGQPGSLGHKTWTQLSNGSYPGSVIAVQPHKADAPGIETYPSVSAVPVRIDLAVIVAPTPDIPDIIGECVAARVKGAIVISSEQDSHSEHAAALNQRIAERTAGSRMRLLGPGSMGVINPALGLNATPGLPMPVGGGVAFISQSGAIGRAILEWSLQQIVGLSAFVSVGGMLDVGWSDLIDYFGNDPATHSIVIYMESIGNVRSFLSAAREVSLRQPIVVIKGGRSRTAIHAGEAQTESLAEHDEVLEAAFRRVGVIQVEQIDDLFCIADVLSKQPKPSGPRLMVVSNAPGAAKLAVDSVIANGGTLARLSPASRAELEPFLDADSSDHALTIPADRSPEDYIKAIEVAAHDPECDGVLVHTLPQSIVDPRKMAGLMLNLRKPAGKPILACFMGGDTAASHEFLTRARIPTYSSTHAAARAFHYMWQYSYTLRAIYETPVLHTDSSQAELRQSSAAVIDAARNAGSTLLTDAETSQVLEAYRIGSVYRNPGGGFHSAVGRPQPMADLEQIEIRIAAGVDRQFGPVLIFGAGGRWADIFQDRAVGLAPLNATLARRVMEQTRICSALQRAGADLVSAVEALLVRVSQLLVEQIWIREIEINPLLASRNSLLALNPRVVLYGPEVNEDHLTPPAIRPYPVQAVSSWIMKDGQAVTIRPIRPEDEPRMIRFYERLSDRSVYLRYLHAMGLDERTAHDRLTRICFIDYDREMALVAEHHDPQTGERQMIALGNLMKIQGRNAAEVAVITSDEHQGKGLASELLRRLLDIAREEKLHRVVATTTTENLPMRAVLKRMGFRLTIHLDADEVEGVLDL